MVENKTYIIRRIEMGDRPCGIKDKSVFCRFNPDRKPFGCYRTWCKCDEELFLHRCKECKHSDDENWCSLKECIFAYDTEKYNKVLDENIESYQFTIPKTLEYNIKVAACPICFSEVLGVLNDIEDKELRYHKIQELVNRLCVYDIYKTIKDFLKELKAKQAYLTNHMYEMKSKPDFEEETKQVFKKLIEKYEKEVKAYKES